MPKQKAQNIFERSQKSSEQQIKLNYNYQNTNPIKEENIILEARRGVAVEYLTA